MSALVWARNPLHPYSIHAGDYSICAIGGADGWTYEVWKGREQLQVGLRSWNLAKAWCRRHHTQQERSNANDHPAG